MYIYQCYFSNIYIQFLFSYFELTICLYLIQILVLYLFYYVLFSFIYVLVYATLWGTNVPTRIVKPDIFDIAAVLTKEKKKKK